METTEVHVFGGLASRLLTSCEFDTFGCVSSSHYIVFEWGDDDCLIRKSRTLEVNGKKDLI